MIAGLTACGGGESNTEHVSYNVGEQSSASDTETSAVYMTTEITPEALMEIFAAFFMVFKIYQDV